MNFLRLMKNLSKTRFAWGLLVLVGLVLEGCGLYFQYGLGLNPCVYCVYERALFLTFIFAGLVGLLGPKNGLFRNLANLIFLGGSIGGIMVTIDHMHSVYATGLGASCPLFPKFPDFIKLDEWFPQMFSPTATCGKLDWSLLGLDMPTWIMAAFVVGAIVSALFLLTQLIRDRRRDTILNIR